MKIGVGLIDRNNDRLHLSNWVKSRISAQTTPVSHFIDTAHIIPSSEDCDIVPRVKYIVQQAKKHKIDFLYLFENDDYYPKDYIERMEEARGDADFINSNMYVRYHIGLQHLQIIGHRKGGYNIGGLWSMGFKPEIFDDLWQGIPEHIRGLDSELSLYAQKNVNNVWFNDHHGVAIKGHGVGMYKPTGPHEKFSIPFIQDNLSSLSILTDKSFVDLHYPGSWRRSGKSNDNLRAELKEIFKVEELLWHV